MKCFILCAGSQTRWNRKVLFPQFPYKQLIDIEGEPLLLRTIRQLRERGIEPVIITKNKELMLCEHLDPEDNRFAVSSLMSSIHQWEDDNMFLLGDVRYSEKSLDKIIKTKNKFCGSRGEIFAVRIQDRLDFVRAFQKAIDWSKKNEENKMVGKLWIAYRFFEGFDDVLKHEFGDNYENVKDLETRDFDSQREYMEYLVGLNKKVCDVTIMAHPLRQQEAEELKKKIKSRIVFDKKNCIQDTWFRAWKKRKENRLYHLVLQDDAYLCKNFKKELNKVISYCAENDILVLSLHARDRKELRGNKESFFDKLYGGVAIAIRQDLIEEMLEWCMQYHKKTNNKHGDDAVMRIYFEEKGIKCFYPLPCLVDHRDLPSIYQTREKIKNQRRGSLFFKN